METSPLALYGLAAPRAVVIDCCLSLSGSFPPPLSGCSLFLSPPPRQIPPFLSVRFSVGFGECYARGSTGAVTTCDPRNGTSMVETYLDTSCHVSNACNKLHQNRLLMYNTCLLPPLKRPAKKAAFVLFSLFVCVRQDETAAVYAPTCEPKILPEGLLWWTH